MEKEIKICANCEHVIIEPLSNSPWSDYVFKCKKCVLNVNHITGETVYGTCNTKNWTGQCEDFEVPQSPLERCWAKIRATFKRS